MRAGSLRWPALRWPVLVSLYLATRLVGLGLLPVFLDERIHLRWASWIAQGDRFRLPFISGRGLSVWMLAGVAHGAEDPLLAGRLLTVAVGLVTLVGGHRLALRVTGRPGAADLAALLYIVCPFTLFHDRMILTDSFLSAFTALTLVLALALAEAPRLRTAGLLGLALGLGVVSKTTGLLLSVVPVLAVAVCGRDRRRALGPLAVSYMVAAALAAYPTWLFFGRTRELSGALGAREDEASLAANAATNLRLAWEWVVAYWTPGLIALAVAGLAFALSSSARRRPAIVLAVTVAGPILAFVAVSEIWYPRYLLFTTVPLLPLAAWGFVSLVDAARVKAHLGTMATGVLAAVVMAVALAPALRFDAKLWTDPAAAPFPPLDRFQYVTGWPSGYGSRDTVDHLRQRSATGEEAVTVVSPASSATAGLLRYLSETDRSLSVVHLDPRDPASVEHLAALARTGATYVLVSPIQGARAPEAWASGLQLDFVSFKPDGAETDRLYRVCGPPGCAP